MIMVKHCFCCSLRQGASVIGTYSLIVYCVAFALEFWWITEAVVSLPGPAYALCGLYFFLFVMGIVLLLGLLLRQQKCLLTWAAITVLSFFPEGGMVLFMSRYWPSNNYEYFVVEIAFWAIRAIFNIFGVLGVSSLYLVWKDEQRILKRLNHLKLTQLQSQSGREYQTTKLRRPSSGNQRGSLNQFTSITLQGGCENLGYKWDSPDHRLCLRPQSQPCPSSRTSQSFTNPSYIRNLPHQNRTEKGRRGRQFNPASLFDPTLAKSTISEWGIAGVGLTRGLPGNGTLLQRAKSDWNVSNEDYWARAPPSRPVSYDYVNRPCPSLSAVSDNYDDQTGMTDDGKCRKARISLNRAVSADGLHHFYRYAHLQRMSNVRPEYYRSHSSMESAETDN